MRISKKAKSLLEKLATFLLILGVIIPSAKTLALTQGDIQDLLNQHPFYSDTENGGYTSCASSTTADYPGSGPLYGPYFPKIADPNDLVERIRKYIEPVNPHLAQYASDFVTYGQQYNINPALLVGVGVKDSSLGTNDYGQDHPTSKTPDAKYNFWNLRDGNASDSTGFATFADYKAAIIKYYDNLRNSGLYDSVWAKGDAATIDDIIKIATPASDNNRTDLYIAGVKKVMHDILDGIKMADGTTATTTIGPSSTPVCSCLDTSASNPDTANTSGGSGAADSQNQTPSTSTCAGVDAILATIQAFAWPDYNGVDSCLNGTDADTCLHVKGKPAYVAALRKTGAYTGDASVALGADCGAFVTAVMRESGADPKYNSGNGDTSMQKIYLDQHRNLYTRIGDSTSEDFVKKLLPGDIAVNSHHTYIFVGNAIPGWGGTAASASQNDRTGMASYYYASTKGIPFTWYRINQ